MKFRQLIDWIRKHPGVVSAVALVVIALTFIAIYRNLRGAVPQSPWPTMYCYDLNTGKIFQAPKNRLPPFETESGGKPHAQPAGVWAAVFSCGECSDESKRFVGWLEVPAPDAHARMKATMEQYPTGAPEGLLENATANLGATVAVSGPPRAGETPQWVEESQTSAQTIKQKVVDVCGGKIAPSRCMP